MEDLGTRRSAPTQHAPTHNAGSDLSRRRLLSLFGIGAAATVVPGALASCSSGNGGTPTGPVPTAQLNSALPNYIPLNLVQPDFPSVSGSTAGFSTMPAELVDAVTSVPGKGGTYTAMTPAWWTVPPGLKDNQYYQAVNKELGATLDFQVSDGNTYGEKVAAVLASAKDIPDWFCIPWWNIPPRFGDAIDTLFTDLTDYLAGDKVKDYPHLANIGTDAWKYCVFNGRLYGLPFPGEIISDAIFYRRDLFDQLGVAAPTSAEELLAVAKEVTDPSKKRYGTEDLTLAAFVIFGAPPKWRLKSDGTLEHRYETPEYKAALEWATKLFAAGVVHPDAVAGIKEKAKERFESGQTLFTFDGVGGWHESLSRVRPSNPDFNPMALDFFKDDGSEPVIFKGNPANIFSFLKKTDDPERVKELLRIANFIASPFGTQEHVLLNYGVEGVHYKKDADGVPQKNDLGNKEVTLTYNFLVNAPTVNAKVEFPEFVKDYCEWMARQAPKAQDPLFYGVQITEPSQYASIAQPFVDLEADVVRGRKSLKDVDAAIATWKKAGGDALREFYTGYLPGNTPSAASTS